MKRALPALTLAVVLAATVSGCAPHDARPAKTASPSASARPTSSTPPIPAQLSMTELGALPAAVYDAVIPGLLAAPAPDAQKYTTAMTVGFDTAVYADDFATPVARIPARDFLGQPTVVVPVATRGGWSLVLTPSRSVLPSQAPAGTTAPAQTVAWVPTGALRPLGALPNRIVVSVSAQTLTITDAGGTAQQTFTIGVGTPETPTPTGVAGYVQARYLDPAQDQSVHRIQLTSLHATGADEPYGGSDGGLIGIHYQDTAAGAVSHGCLRLTAEAIAAVDALALGTPVRITD